MGVANVEDLKHVLGTAEDSSSTKSTNDDSKDQASNKNAPAEDDQFYRDSSTFLKVLRFIDILLLLMMIISLGFQ